MSGPFDGVTLVLAVPIVAAALLAVLPGYRLSARLNMIASFLTLLAALSLFVKHPGPSTYFLIDDLNSVFIVLNQRLQRKLYRA
jgi:hydrogenase-4 component F